MPARKCRVQWRVKRTLDIAIATTLLLALSPLLALLALLIKRDGGPCFFSHPRVGMHGRTFRCLKFRSMVRDADKVLNDLLASDPKARAETLSDGRSVLKARVRAAPTEGEANAALISLLAKMLDVPRRAVTLAAGETARIKRIVIDGDGAALAARLERLVTDV